MYRSAIESEVRLKVARFSAVLRQRDRGVLLGLVFCAIPIPPVALLGIVIGLVNLRLVARDRLPIAERRLIWIALAVGCLSLLIGTVLFVNLVILAWRLPGEGVEAARPIFYFLYSLLERLIGGPVRLPTIGSWTQRI